MVIELIGHSWGQLDASYHGYQHLATYLCCYLAFHTLTIVGRKKLFSMSKNVAAFSSCRKVTANCNCMTGLEETCSHLDSIMFFIEAAIRLREASRYPGSCILEIALSRDVS